MGQAIFFTGCSRSPISLSLKLPKLGRRSLVRLDPSGQPGLPRVEKSFLKLRKRKCNQQSNHFCCDGGKKKRPVWMTKQLWTTKKVNWNWKEVDLKKNFASKDIALKGKWIRKEFWSVRMQCLITLNSPLSLPEFFLSFFKNNLLTSLRPQLSSVTQITRCCIP